ncbi:hypothetical protein D641_0108935 [Brachybacterium muris UCD-AY4]|uniref:Transposase n=1 Tax=Brachybacterium muris UCD-AY4 TaxID=1249481 RepID=A0A022L083_9MICO|nr:hypothetical protein D641_0108935 [Brachybacterium muris UCD-AY4]
MIAFIDMHRDQFGVEAICRILGATECGFITSRGYRASKNRNASARSVRAMSRRRSNMGLAGEQSSECLGGREIAQSAAGSIVDLLGDGGEVGLVIGDHRALLSWTSRAWFERFQ